IVTLLLIFFFLHCYVHLRLLHSFPTRRSSDLARAARALPDRAAGHLGRDDRRQVGAAAVRARRDRPALAPARPPGDRGGALRARSEEHTSELQSQSNLVCRLLLEKKKQKTKQM